MNKKSLLPSLLLALVLDPGVANARAEIPDRFVGRFEYEIPGKTGGTVNDSKMIVRCKKHGVCFVTIGATTTSFADVRALASLERARESLSYAQAHRVQPPGSPRASIALRLSHFLASPAAISECLDLRNIQAHNPIGESFLVCTIEKGPWQKQTVLAMWWTMRDGADPLFSTYEIQPLVRNDPPVRTGGLNQSSDALKLSSTQANFESMALIGQGGLHELHGYLGLGGSFAQHPSYNRSAMLYTSAMYVGSAEKKQAYMMRTESIALTLQGKLQPYVTVPGARFYLVNGEIVQWDGDTAGQVRYAEEDVLVQSFASDNQTVVKTLRYSNARRIELSGALTQAPADLRDDTRLGELLGSFNGKPLLDSRAQWRPGAAYLLVDRRTEGDRVELINCVGAPVSRQLVPCAGQYESIESYVAQRAFTGGALAKVQGVQAWVREGSTSANLYKTRELFFFKDGQIYRGFLRAHGSPEKQFTGYRQLILDHAIFINDEARASIEDAIAF